MWPEIIIQHRDLIGWIDSRQGRSPLYGFTLLEMLVAVACISILLGLAVPSYAHWRAQLALNAAVQTLNTQLALTRAHAMAWHAPVHLEWDAGASSWKHVARLGQQSITVSETQVPLAAIEIEYHGFGHGPWPEFFENGIHASNGRFILRHRTAMPEITKHVVINKLGRVREHR